MAALLRRLSGIDTRQRCLCGKDARRTAHIPVRTSAYLPSRARRQCASAALLASVASRRLRAAAAASARDGPVGGVARGRVLLPVRSLLKLPLRPRSIVQRVGVYSFDGPRGGLETQFTFIVIDEHWCTDSRTHVLYTA